jgi:toxoflavin synthase
MSQYDLLASLTEATAAAPLRKHFEEHSFFEALGDVRGQSVLDIGCGTGLYTRRLKQRGAATVLGLDASAGMIEYARHLESLQPLGIEYVVKDAADAGGVGRFDVVTATYLLHYAPSREAMSGMCRSIHEALVPGGRLVSICLAPEINLTDPGYYHPYGFEMASRGGEGAEVTMTSVMPEMPFTIKAYAWSRATYEAALAEAGFKEVRWYAPRISPEGLKELGRGYWQAYLDQPHAAIFDCTT